MATKKTVEIEKLLQWAYGDELIKRAMSSAEGIWDHIEEWGQRGGIDPGHGAAQRYPHFGLPHPDAEKIEAAVGTLRPMVVDWAQSVDAIMGDLAALFNARDVMLVGTLHVAALVQSCAIQKSRPDWMEEAPRPERVRAERGRDRPMIIGECKGKDRYTTGSYCPLTWDPSATDIALKRARYYAWHDGLCRLAASLELDEHHVLVPDAPARPWAGERAPTRRVFAIGERIKGRPLPLKPERPRARRFTPKKNEEPA